MRSSCRFAMAVHVLAVLAYQEGDRVTSHDLAGSVNTNPVIVRRLLLSLQRAGLVETTKGAGSRLSRSPKRINLAEIYRAVEEEEAFVLPPNRPNEECPVGQWVQESLQEAFAAAESALEGELAKTSLGSIVDVIRSKCRKGLEV
ncbi:MAG: Rrf2 family transcriptional regulator [Verrucomicrobiota bacterium]|nr:Rrf2 family transcriptional regulator [Verrucomicrobiota bacterium]